MSALTKSKSVPQENLTGKNIPQGKRFYFPDAYNIIELNPGEMLNN